MQNLIVLCQCCLSWIEPHAEMCPECGAEVDLDRPDMNSAKLGEVLGNPVLILGPARVERQGLPNYGFLIGTSEGVLFLPRLHRRINGAWEGVTAQKLTGWWPFRGDLGSPKFLKWLRRPFANSPSTNNHSEQVTNQNLESLADRLMDSPGAFFIEQRLIRAVTQRRRTVKLDRSPFRSVTLIDETEEGTLFDSLNSLATRVTAGRISV